MKAVAAARSATSARRRLSEVIDAAAKLFARRGYHGASTQDIAEVLGIRQASLYYYFESKEAALEAVCASGAQKVARLVFHHLAPLAGRLDYTLVFLRERRFLPQPARKRIRADLDTRMATLERITQSYVDLLVRAFRLRH